MAAENNKIDLVLVYPPWALPGSRGYLQNGLPPLGILSIASYVEQKGFSVQVLDVQAERLDENEVAVRIAALRPRVVGISVLTHMVIPAHRIARLCKEWDPSCTVVVGGVHAEVMPEDMLSNRAIDIVVRGDGEETMLDILGGLPCPEIRGISYREGQRVVHTPPRPVERDLDKYPFPAYHLINFKLYFPAVGSYRRLPAINMLMTRGCVGKCTFCNSAGTVIRSRSGASVAAQIKMLRYQYGIRQIQFYDDTFTVMRKNVLDMCSKLIEDKVDITWTAYVRADCFNEELASAMKKAGCYQILLGIETGDETITRNICKPIDREKYRKTVAIAHQYGLEVRGSFIFGNVGETWQTLESSLQFAKDLDIDLMQAGILTPLPGTQVFREATEKGWLAHRHWNEYGAARVLLNLPTITTDEIYRFERHAFRSFYLRPRIILRQLRRIVSVRQLRDLAAAFLMFILGVGTGRSSKMDGWTRYREEEFFDIAIEHPKTCRLTYQVRQDDVFT